ncbi:hypothetical protein Kfla_2584 [Kribbella flavida DSM 17836]|uniref:Uncharacterized protein n=1 Tax=Kribbella flavida (strain DSM 17836 / JCM 10339 / NBRC 14399) TaxID=479435 RepID=D2PXL0_KRIFD|nr:hypothetical protein [Kribbella flavida]ADB31652.1 hypothetical protein Kfla_2584 [Kribbella flavida DSM 17836]
MDAGVLIVFALFFTALVVLTTSATGRIRASVRRPRLFQLVVVGAAAATVPVNVYAVVYGSVNGVPVTDVADRLLLLNVAAACGVAALHESLRGPAVTATPASDDSSEAEQPVRMGVLGWIGPVIALAALTAVVGLGSRGNGPELGNVGSVWAAYSLLICVISAFALLRRRAVSAIDPPEG